MSVYLKIEGLRTQLSEQEFEKTFWGHLEQEWGTQEHSKRFVLRRLAYEYGHPNGYEEVESHYADLVELIDSSTWT